MDHLKKKLFLTAFYKLISVLVESSRPVLELLDTITDSGVFTDEFVPVIKKLKKDASETNCMLSEAMSRQPNVFPPIDIKITEIGESVGDIGFTFNYISSLQVNNLSEFEIYLDLFYLTLWAGIPVQMAIEKCLAIVTNPDDKEKVNQLNDMFLRMYDVITKKGKVEKQLNKFKETFSWDCKRKIDKLLNI